jgi:hypothetical protein
MHTYVANVLSTLDAGRAQFRAVLDAVPEALRHQRPAPDRWSVAEIVHHIALVERRFANVLRERIASSGPEGPGPEQAGWTPLPEHIAARMDDRSSRRNAPAPVHPQSLPGDEALRAAEQSRAELRQVFIDAEGLALSRVFYPHPYFGDLNAYQLAELASRHERRHAEQIREAVQALMEAQGS